MDSGGVPQTSKRAGSRTGGGGVKPPDSKANGKASANGNGNGTTRQGPLDPRTEDASSPHGISRAAKTIWRRPGASISRSAKQPGIAEPVAPSDFSMTLPLAPAPFAIPAAKAGEPVADITETVAPVEPAEVQQKIEVVQPTPWALGVVPTVWMPTTPAPEETEPVTEPVDEPVTEAMPELIPAPILYDEAATIDDVTQIGPVLATRPLHRPIRFRRNPKPRVRRVTRVVRHVDTWSVFKVALVFNIFFYAVALVAGVLLWQVAYATGTVDNVEKFFEGFGWETFKFNGGQIFHNAWIAGLFVAVGFTGLAVLMATLFNLITDLVGGVRFSVLEEEVQTRAHRGTAPVTFEPVEEPTVVEAEVEPPIEQVGPDEVVEQPVTITDEPDEAIAG